MAYFDRYEKFKVNGMVKPIPGIKIPVAGTDKQVLYKAGETRLDKLSQTYYANGYHGFLIMAANPKYGGMEFDIKDRDIIRVPFPFDSAVERYISAYDRYINLYG
jgi:hypothetical protein